MGVEKWTKDEIDLAIDLWRQGVSGSIIGARLKKSRCAVLGKLHRLNLLSHRPTRVQRPNSTRIARQSRHKQRLAAKAVRNPSAFARLLAEPWVPQAAPVIPKDQQKRLHDLGDGECRYPCSDEPPHSFCSRQAVPGLPYCDVHARICFVPPQSRPRGNLEAASLGDAKRAHAARPRPDTDIHAVLTAFDQLERVR
jgi:GcrA cell cycle regulator